MTTVPDILEGAFGALGDLVGRIAAGEGHGEGALREEMDHWFREDCRGSSTLAEAAALTLKYEIASTGARAQAEKDAALVGAMRARLGALSRVETVLRPPGTRPQDSAEKADLVEVALPEAQRRITPNARAFVMGPLQIIFEPLEGPSRVHLSVSHPARYPSWEELRRVASALGGPRPNLWAWLPKPDQGAATHTIDLYVRPPEGLLD